MPTLENGSRVAVIGAGPAGSFFSYFLREFGHRAEVDVAVDIYESRDFTRPGPTGCNMCGGIVSESLVQMLAAEGIILPPTAIQRGIDSYVMHSEQGTVRVDTPLHEMRIGAVHRGSGPRDVKTVRWSSLDGHLLSLAKEQGANVIPARVEAISRDGDKFHVTAKGRPPETYDLVVGAVGVNGPGRKVFEDLGFDYKSPKTTKAFVAELRLGEEEVTRSLGHSMHVFLLNLPRLEFAALIPKGEYVTMCLLGDDVQKDLVEAFLNHPEVASCFPPETGVPEPSCHCSPHLFMGEAAHPYGEGVVMIGDCSVSRLYKDGIGAAYRTAKAAAATAMFSGVAAEDFKRHYEPACRKIANDNRFGKVVFAVVGIFRALPFSTRAMLRMTEEEQRKGGSDRPMSMMLWDTFTGSAPYRDIFLRAMRPMFLLRLAGKVLWALFSRPSNEARGVQP